MSASELIISALVFAGAALALYAALRFGVAVLLRGLRSLSERPEGAESMANPLHLLAVALSFHVALHLVYREPDRVFPGWFVVNELSKTFLFFALVWVGIRMLAAFIHSLYVADHATSRVPLLLEKIINALLYGTAGLLILHFYFGFSVTPILGVGAVASIVGGIAFQDTLRSFFAGISLNLDDAFHVGDLVQVAGFKGVVVDTDWRTTMLRSLHNDFVTIPNKEILEAPIINFHRPERRHRSRLLLDTAPHVPPDAARQVLCACALTAEGVLAEPAPEALLADLSAERARYTLWFSIDDYAENERIESRIRTLCWYRLGREGMLPGGKRAVPVETKEFLKVFARLDEEARRKIAERGEAGRYGAGERLFVAGAAAGALYLIADGGVMLGAPSPEEEGVVLEAGALAGAEALQTGGTYKTTAVVQRESVLVKIGRDALSDARLEQAVNKLV